MSVHSPREDRDSGIGWTSKLLNRRPARLALVNLDLTDQSMSSPRSPQALNLGLDLIKTCRCGPEILSMKGVSPNKKLETFFLIASPSRIQKEISEKRAVQNLMFVDDSLSSDLEMSPLMQKVLRTPKMILPQHFLPTMPDRRRRRQKDRKNQCGSSNEMDSVLGTSAGHVQSVRPEQGRCCDNKSNSHHIEGHHQPYAQEYQVEWVQSIARSVGGGLEAPAKRHDARADTYTPRAEMAQPVALRSLASLGSPRVREEAVSKRGPDAVPLAAARQCTIDPREQLPYIRVDYTPALERRPPPTLDQRLRLATVTSTNTRRLTTPFPSNPTASARRPGSPAPGGPTQPATLSRRPAPHQVPLPSATSQHIKSVAPHGSAKARLGDCGGALFAAALHDAVRVGAPLPQARQSAGGHGVRAGMETGSGPSAGPGAAGSRSWAGGGLSWRGEGRVGKRPGLAEAGLTQTLRAWLVTGSRPPTLN
jgi:hypothetical protein